MCVRARKSEGRACTQTASLLAFGNELFAVAKVGSSAEGGGVGGGGGGGGTVHLEVRS